VAAYLAQFPRGFEDEAINCVAALTMNMRFADVAAPWWPLGKVLGLWKSSIYNAAPLHRLVRREYSQEAIRSAGRKLRIGAVSLDGGEYAVFDEQCEHLHEAILASCAFPGVLLPVEIRGQLFVDGGVRVYTPIAAAIDAGATHIDIVMTSPENPSPARLSKASALHVMARSLDLMMDEVIDKDLKLVSAYNRLAALASTTKRPIVARVIRPAHELPIGTWDFDSPHTVAVRACGLRDAQLALGSKALVE
jgi:predicted acylesterase/phospholipase RssA